MSFMLLMLSSVNVQFENEVFLSHPHDVNLEFTCSSSFITTSFVLLVCAFSPTKLLEVDWTFMASSQFGHKKGGSPLLCHPLICEAPF